MKRPKITYYNDFDHPVHGAKTAPIYEVRKLEQYVDYLEQVIKSASFELKRVLEDNKKQ